MLMQLDRLVNVYVTDSTYSVVNVDSLCTLVEIHLHCSFYLQIQCFLHIYICGSPE